MPVCTAEECKGTVRNTVCIHIIHPSAHCEAEASEAKDMVVPTIQVIGVVPSIVFFQTLEWIALFLARVDVTCSGVLGGASMSACPVSSP